jgi:hypothetical protein
MVIQRMDDIHSCVCIPHNCCCGPIGQRCIWCGGPHTCAQE